MPSRPNPKSLADALVVSTVEGRRMLRIGNTKMHELLRAGHLDSVKIGRARRISVASIQKLAADGIPQNRFKRGIP